MTPVEAPPEPHRWSPQLTIRARLTVTYSVLVLATGGAMLAIVYAFMRFVPTYQIMATPSVPATNDAVPLADDAGTGLTGNQAIVLTSAAEILDTLLVTSLVVLVVLAAVGGVIGWIVAGRMLRPLQAINEAAALAGQGSLAHRIELAGPDDELHRLADTFDSMLVRLDRSFAASERFTANAAHELRTPLAATKTLLDVARSHPGRQGQEELVAKLAQTNDRSIHLVQALLELASIGQQKAHLERIDLADVAAEVVEEHRDEARGASVTLSTALAPAVLTADATLIRHLLRNLVGNAIRHNVPGGSATVGTASTATGATLVVRNTGPLVGAEALALLTEPFFRAAGRVDAGTPGHGLGLAVVDSVVAAHAGTLSIEANPHGGLTVSVEIPTVRS